jgi:hypothetical protein
MKLKYFTEQTLPKQVGGGMRGIARVTFGAAGAIVFNKEAGKLMSLKTGDRVALAQDEQDPENWYFFKDKNHGYEIRENKGNGWGFNHSLLIHAFLESRGLEKGKTLRALIAGQPTEMKGDKSGTLYWGILIRPQ